MSENITKFFTGKQFPAIKQIRLYDTKEWEEFIEEWLTVKGKEYIEVENLGGAVDQGRDLIGIVSKGGGTYIWDNYQCKHYDHSLYPGDIWIELGKLCFYTFNKEFPIPRKYYFVAPFGVGTTLSDLIRNSNKINAQLIENWNKKCKKGITNFDVELEGDLLNYVKDFDFSILEKISPLTIITEHMNGNPANHAKRFGTGLPSRPEIYPVPKEIKSNELNYINNLLDAYGDETETKFHSVDALPKDSRYLGHLNRARESFHQAEQLKQFSRDKIDIRVFKAFKDEILSGVIDISEDNHENGYKCVKEVEKEARRMSILSNPISLCSDSNDRVGICHHLSNENELNWLNYEKK